VKQAEPIAAVEPQYGLASREQAQLLSGLEFIQAMVEGKFPLPPICKTLQFRLVEIEKGRALFTGVPVFDFYNPLGTVHGGYAATLLDSCMGCAVHTTLPAGVGYTTLEFKVNFVRPLTQETGLVRAEGKVISSGKRVATAEGKLFDERGTLYSHATTTCLVFPI
jgi:uncharacterized protein (TIGR00369 family)